MPDFCNMPLVGTVCDVKDAIDFVNDPGAAIGEWIAASCGQLVAAAADLAADAVNTTTHIDLGASWFRDNYQLLMPIGLMLLVATFCAQLIRAAFRRDGQALRQAFTGTASGVLFMFVAIAATTVAIEVVDALSDGLFYVAGSSLEDAVRRMVNVAGIASLGPMGWLVMVFAALGATVGALLYWCVMMVRKIGILVLVTLAVFAAAGGGWEAMRRMRRGWIIATGTLVVSKLLMTVIFLLGISAVGRAETDGGIAALSDVMAGIVIMVLVLLCPYATFKFVSWATEGADGESLHRAGGAGAAIARQHTERAGRKAVAAMAMAGTGGAAAAAATTASPQGPASVPGQGPGGVLAANPTGQHGGSQTGSTSLNKTAEPAPTNRETNSSDRLAGNAGAAHTGGAPADGPWHQSASPTPATPQSANTAPASAHGNPSGHAAPPPPPAGT
jgi:hypothetical protein